MSEDSRPRSTDRPRRASRPAVTGARACRLAGRSAPAARPCVAGAGSRRPEGRREMLSLGTYRELRWHAMHRREPSGEGRAGASAMVLAMALGLARARASRRLEFLPTLSRQTSRESRTTGPRADNRSARLPQLIAVSGRRAGVIGLKRRRMSRHAVPCGRADSDLTPIGRRHGGRRTTGVARNADSVRGQASVRALVPTGVAAHLPAHRGDAPRRNVRWFWGTH